MKPLPNRQLGDSEIQHNFEFVEESLSELQLADAIIAAEVGGTKAKKIPVKDARGKIVGYIPLYST